MRNLPLLTAAIAFSSCIRSPDFEAMRLQEDRSIVFPKFYDRFPVVMDKQDQPYVLDGVTLRAISIAANEFFPPPTPARPCWQSPEGHNYRVIRQEDIIFVRIELDFHSCHPPFMRLDGGVTYAISKDGRILRRLFDSEPDGTSEPESLDGGEELLPDGGSPYTVAPSIPVGFTGGAQPKDFPPRSLDAGTHPVDAGSLPPSATPDGGAPLPAP